MKQTNWNLYITRIGWRRPEESPAWYIVLPSCFPVVFGADWDTIRTRVILGSSNIAKLQSTGDVQFTREGLLRHLRKDADPVELCEWLDKEEAARILRQADL